MKPDPNTVTEVILVLIALPVGLIFFLFIQYVPWSRIPWDGIGRYLSVIMRS